MYTKESLIRHNKEKSEYYSFTFIGSKFRRHSFKFDKDVDSSEETAYLAAMDNQTFIANTDFVLKLFEPILSIRENKNKTVLAVSYVNSDNLTSRIESSSRDVTAVLDKFQRFRDEYLEKLKESILCGQKCNWNIDYK